MSRITKAEPKPGPAPWQPSADVYRTKDGWLVKFDLAGVQIGDVTVAMRGRRLAISGVRRDSFHGRGFQLLLNGDFV